MIGKTRRKAGRPAGERDTRTLILDIAEQQFADRGYAGASTRDIARHASVTQSMISYYFGSKHKLFEAVFKRRGMALSERRMTLLEALRNRPGPPPTIEELVRAYLTPQFEMKAGGAGELAFVRLQARLHNEPEELAFRLRREVYDHSTKRYIAEIEARLPHISAADLNWRMVFLIGAYLYMLSDVDRLHDLSDGRFRSDDIDELVARLSHFLAFGMQAPDTPFPLVLQRAEPGKPSDSSH